MENEMTEYTYALTQKDIDAINRLLKNAHKMGGEYITVINMNVLSGKLVDFEIGVSEKDFRGAMPLSLATNNKTISASVDECLAGVE